MNRERERELRDMAACAADRRYVDAIYECLDAIAAQRARIERLEKALVAATSFVGHAADAEDGCGCDDCREEWAEIQRRIAEAMEEK